MLEGKERQVAGGHGPDHPEALVWRAQAQVSESRENRSWRYHLRESWDRVSPGRGHAAPPSPRPPPPAPGGGPGSHARSPPRQGPGGRGSAHPLQSPPPASACRPGRTSRAPPLTWLGQQGSAKNRKQWVRHHSAPANGPRCPSNRRASGGCRGVEWTSRGRARPAGGRVPGPQGGFHTWPSVGVRTQAPTPAGSKGGLGPRPPGPPFPHAGGRRPHTHGALGGEYGQARGWGVRGGGEGCVWGCWRPGLLEL